MQNNNYQAMQSLRAAMWPLISCTGSEKAKIIFAQTLAKV